MKFIFAIAIGCLVHFEMYGLAAGMFAFCVLVLLEEIADKR